ncbi:MAG: hypothetical protein IJ525_03710 [Alphaproteobacteria bacterium]|nr:hypothetical protein [Alphaproteobacteria bacterium]
MTYSNWKILKTDISEKQEDYSKVAQWCNDGQEYHIEEQGEYYTVVKNSWSIEEKIKQSRINELKKLLQQTDYAIIKIAEGAATAEQYADVIAKRQGWRAEINELEG